MAVCDVFPLSRKQAPSRNAAKVKLRFAVPIQCFATHWTLACLGHTLSACYAHYSHFLQYSFLTGQITVQEIHRLACSFTWVSGQCIPTAIMSQILWAAFPDVDHVLLPCNFAQMFPVFAASPSILIVKTPRTSALWIKWGFHCNWLPGEQFGLPFIWILCMTKLHEHFGNIGLLKSLTDPFLVGIWHCCFRFCFV